MPKVNNGHHDGDTTKDNGKQMSRGFLWAISICAFLLVAACVLSILGLALSGRGRVMSFYSSSVDEELYAYWQARFRYEYIIYYKDIGAVDTNIFWDKVKDQETGITYGEDCQALTDSLIERIVVAAYLYDQNGYKLSDHYRSEIRTLTEERVKIGVFKGKDDYNTKAAYFGFDWNTYVEATVYELKATLLGQLYVPSEEAQHAFYENNYMRVKMVFVSESHGQMADTITFLRTALENGVDEAQFDKWVNDTTYNDDPGSANYLEGYYFSPTAAFTETYFETRPQVKEPLFSLEKAGDWCEVKVTEGPTKGTLFIYRYDLPKTAAYSQEMNGDFFTDLTQDAADESFSTMILEYTEEAVWEEEKKKRIPAAGYGNDIALYMFFS